MRSTFTDKKAGCVFKKLSIGIRALQTLSSPKLQNFAGDSFLPLCPPTSFLTCSIVKAMTMYNYKKNQITVFAKL